MIEIHNIMFERDNKSESVRRQISKAIGVLVCLTGGFLMFHGSILGDRTIDIARVMGIIGIGIITSSNSSTRNKHKEGF
jgi:hypothetical protein